MFFVLNGLWFHAHNWLASSSQAACRKARMFSRPPALRSRSGTWFPLSLGMGGEDAQLKIARLKSGSLGHLESSVGVVLWRGHFARYGGLL